MPLQFQRIKSYITELTTPKYTDPENCATNLCDTGTDLRNNSTSGSIQTPSIGGISFNATEEPKTNDNITLGYPNRFSSNLSESANQSSGQDTQSNTSISFDQTNPMNKSNHTEDHLDPASEKKLSLTTEYLICSLCCFLENCLFYLVDWIGQVEFFKILPVSQMLWEAEILRKLNVYVLEIKQCNYSYGKMLGITFLL